MVTATEVRHKLHYDPDTGVFTWKNPSKYRPEYVDRMAGSLCKSGYTQISIDGVLYKAHRLAWLYVHGEFPHGLVDHINGVRTDNRIENLRRVTHSENACNRRTARAGHAIGLLGVVWRPRNRKYEARISVDGKYKYLGLFDTAEEAHAAYVVAKRKYHPTGTL